MEKLDNSDASVARVKVQMIAGEDDALRLFPVLRKARGVDHWRSDLFGHLVGTWQLLTAWGAPRHVALAGLAHSIYGTSGFDEAIQSLDRRDEVADQIGRKAEHLAFLFGVIDRQQAWSWFDKLDQLPSRPFVTCRDTNASLRISRRTFQNLVLIETANIADQSMETDGGPAPWQMQAADRLRKIGFTLPSVGVLDSSSGIESERAAIAMYNSALRQTRQEASRTLSDAIRLNPLAAEPRILKSLCALEAGDGARSLDDARIGRHLLGAWSVPWDKRLGFVTWDDIASALIDGSMQCSNRSQNDLLATVTRAILRRS
jgi:hypothetical protein